MLRAQGFRLVMSMETPLKGPKMVALILRTSLLFGVPSCAALLGVSCCALVWHLQPHVGFRVI